MKNPFEYQPPTEEQKTRLKAVNVACLTAYDALLANCPPSADRTIAQRKLQEFRMWANASIVLEEAAPAAPTAQAAAQEIAEQVTAHLNKTL